MKNFWQTIPRPILALSPMAGVTDAAFRIMCKHFGADVIYTEFASANALISGNQATRNMIRFAEEERPVVCQIFGQDPRLMGAAATILEQLGFDGVDINFGCPAYKVVKHGGGVCLMRNPALVRNIVEEVCKSVKHIPVSIKIRGSIFSVDKKHEFFATEVIEAIRGLPVAAVMVHGRSFEKPFDGTPNTNIIKEVVDRFQGVVLANGGVYTPEDAKKLLEETGAAGLGIARGAWGHPWIFKQIKEFLSAGTYASIAHDEMIQYIIEHATLALQSKGPYGIVEMRKHLARYVRGFEGASQLRSALVRASTIDEITKIFEKRKTVAT